MSDIEFYYDVVCPYAYIATSKIQTLAQKYNKKIRWVPILLGGIYRHWKTPDIPAQTWPKSKQNYSKLDLKRQAQNAGVVLKQHPKHPLRTVKAMRLLCSVSDDIRPHISLEIFKSYWSEGKNIDEDHVLNQIASKFNLAPNLFLSPSAKEQLFQNTQEAFDKGVFGVPSIFVDKKMWWGQDRLLFVEKAIGGLPRKWPAKKKSNQRIEFYHDFSSPFSYLGAMQINKMSELYGVDVDWKPMLLGALFRNIGTPSVPLFEMSRGKQKYLLKDLKDWSDWWGVPFRFPDVFPVRTLLPLRLALVDPSLNDVFYKALWAENKNIGDEKVVLDLLIENGKDPKTLYEQIPKAKQKLIENTTRATEIGICGAPSIYNGHEIWWGQDRLYDFAQELCKMQAI